jgi:hypothetical protein
MDQVAQQQLQGREAVVARIHNVADAERRKQSVRETLLSLIGGLPDYSGPLNPSIRGRIQTEKYTIEGDLRKFAGLLRHPTGRTSRVVIRVLLQAGHAGG